MAFQIIVEFPDEEVANEFVEEMKDREALTNVLSALGFSFNDVDSDGRGAGNDTGHQIFFVTKSST